ncbi:MAG TPA: MFS transporter [Ktedonobacterales bacterium]|nr:MFS transporter [Ktedonobacterales bacterium]
MQPETPRSALSLRQRLWPAWMTRDVSLVILARLFMSGARALAGIVTPIYLALIGFSALKLGWLFVAVAITSAIFTSAVGLLSDRIGRKPFLIALPLFAAIAAIVFAITRSVPLLFAFAALGSFGRGAGAGGGSIGPYQPAEQALLAEAAPPRARNDVFGRMAFASSLGAVIGGGPLATLPDLLPHLGMGGADGMAGYRAAFIAMAGLASIAALLVIPIADHRPARPRDASGAARGARSWNPLRRISPVSWPILLRLWVTNSINGLAVGFFGPFITYWFFRRYGAGAALVGALFTAVNLAALASNLYAPRLAERLGLVRAIFWGRTLQAVLMIPMVLAPTFWLAGLFYLIRMQAQRIALPLRQSYVMAVVPTHERGTVAAFSNLPTQVTSAITPGIAGYLFDTVSLELPFEIGAALQFLNAALFYLFFHRAPPPEERAAEHPSPPAALDEAALGVAAVDADTDTEAEAETGPQPTLGAR